MNESEDDMIVAIVPDADKLPCANCAYGCISGYKSHTCMKYEIKPRGVYYYNEECPHFKPFGNKVNK